jgi:type IV conjugative transfer system coupling protein TraD
MTTITQGGQTSIHSFRMGVTIIRFILRFFIIMFVVLLGMVFYTKTDKQTLKNNHDYYQAKLISLYQKDLNHEITIKDSAGNNVNVAIGRLINNQNLINSSNKTVNDIKKSLKLSLIISVIITLFLIVYFIKKGTDLGKSKHIRGGSVVKAKLLTRMVKRYNKRTLFMPKLVYRIRRMFTIIGLLDQLKPYNQQQKQYEPYKIANNIPYPAHTETQHTIITGGSGTGKTQMLKHLLTQIKQKGDRAIVYDKMGSFIPHFYEEAKGDVIGDVILNPFDKRSPIWSIFNEVEETLQLDSIASALMPITKNISDPFWVQASRTIFTSVASKMKEQGETSNKNLVDNLLKTDLSDIAKIIKGTPAQAIIDERSPKTALSVMSVLSTYLSSLKYLKDAPNVDTNGQIQKTFSIRNWVKNDDSSSFLFISSRGDQHESLKPLISTWLEIGINSLLSIKQNRNRRIWVILDELPSLHMLPSLNSGIAESRQFGGCFVLSLQLMAQLRSIYGKDDAETISGLAKTRIIFSSPDEDTARWCSNSLGKKEQEDVKKNISYGANEIRDGVSLNTHQTTENLVIPTEIMNLHNLECYIKLPFNFPIAKTKIKVHKSKEIAERFIKDHSTEFVSDIIKNNVVNESKTNINNDNMTTEQTTTNQQIPQNPIIRPTIQRDFLEGNPWEIMRECQEKWERERVQKEEEMKEVDGDVKITKEGDTTMDIVLDNTKIEQNTTPQDKKDSSSDNNSNSFIF